MASIIQDSLLPPQPVTQRNFTVHLSYDEATNSIAYPSGKSAFVRYLDEAPDAKIPKVIQFTGHGTANVTVVKFSPIKNSQYIASGDESGKVIVWGWSLNDETKAVEINVKAEFSVLAGKITDLSWDFEGHRLCVVGEGKDRFGVFISWDSGNSLGEVSGHSQRINACHMKQSRPMRAITVGDDGAVVFYQGPPFKFASSDRTHHDQGKFTRDVQFSPNAGEYVISVGSDRRMVCFDGKTGEFQKYIEDESVPVEGGIYALSWLDDTRFAIACADGSIKVFDVTTSKCVQNWTIPNATLNDTKVGIVAAKDDQVIALSLDGSLNFYKLGNEGIVRSIQGHNKGITSLIVNPIVTGSYDGRIMDWTAEPSTMHNDHSNLVVSIDNSSYPNISSVSWDDTLKVNEKTVYSFNGQPKVAQSNNDGITAVVTSKDSLVLLNSFDGTVINELKLKDSASAVGISSRLVAVAYEASQSVEVFKITDLSVNYKLGTPLRSTPSNISISASEKYLAAGDVSGKILLFDLETKELKTSRWAFHTSKINSISWKPCSGDEEEEFVATGSLDTNICVYSIKRPMRVIKYMNAHKDGVNAVEWSDDKSLTSAGNDGCIKTWTVNFE